MVVLVMGLPGSGKSYLARRLAELIGATYISSDRVRRDLFPAARYTAEEKAGVYEEMQTRAAAFVAICR